MPTLEIKVLDSTNKDFLCDYYEKMQEERLLASFLYSDSSLQNFLDFTYKQWIYTCFLDDIPCGFTLFNDFKGKSAFFHFCMFENGKAYSLEFGKMIFETVFRNNSLQIIFGLTPKIYRHVFPLLYQIGMKEIFEIEEACILKGKKRAGIVSCITKKRFYEVNINKNQNEKEKAL